MKKILKDYFSFNKTERRGLFVLLFLIVLLISANQVLPFIIPQKEYDFSAFRKDIEEFEKNRIVLTDVANKNYPAWKEFDYSHPDKSAEVSKLNPFPFDPNLMEEKSWKTLGMTDKQIRMLENYKTKGGTFRSKMDFKKMYCISQQEFDVLAPYIQLPETSEKSKTYPSYSPEKEAEAEISVEINSATTEELTQLKGIGEYFAKNIISYRRLLGGFCRKEQLLEVYKMDSVRYNQIAPNVTINTNAIRRINVNTASFEELSKHPYIGYNVALSLTNYRANHGNYAQLADIKKSALVTENLYKKLSPYLKV